MIVERGPVASDPLSSLTGLSLHEFSTTHWGVAPLLVRAARRSGALADLLSLDAVDELLSRRGLRTPFMRMSRDGEILSPARYTRGGGAGAEIADQIADDKVLAEFSDGATLVLQGLHRLWPPVMKFASEFSAQIGHPVQINAYVTPPQNAGFAPHYDVHDVFVLQFAGRKHWRVHEPVLASPLRSQPWDTRKASVATRSSETPILDCVLEPGDMLYLPRGYLHGATSLGEVSGHLTIGVHPLTRHALVDEMVSTFGSDVRLRRSLPIGVDLSDAAVLDDEIDATIAALHAAIDRVDRAAIARAIGRRLAATTRPAPLRPIEQLAAANAFRADMLVHVRPGLRFASRIDGEHLVIELPDRQIRLAASARDAVTFATSGAYVTANDLPSIDVRDAVTLLAQLLRDGIVVPA